MNSRALLLIGALLASSARAQDPSFDLTGDAIKKIVHDRAASLSQPVQVQGADTKPVEPELVFGIEYVTPVAAPAVKSTPPRRVAVPTSGDFFSTLVDILVEAALGVDDENAPVANAALLAPPLQKAQNVPAGT